jgi:hypothetical protein
MNDEQTAAADGEWGFVMPIKFRCVYCEQLLGIARRKAGSVVKCPNCEGQLIVPAAESDDEEMDDRDEETEQAPRKEGPSPRKVPVSAGKTSSSSDDTAGGMLFERDNFDELLKPAIERTSGPKPTLKPVQHKTIDLGIPDAAPRVPYVDSAFALPSALPAAAALAPKPKGIVLSPVKLVLLLGFILAVAAGSFIGGLLVGKIWLK